VIGTELREKLEAAGFAVLSIGDGTLVVNREKAGLAPGEPATFELIERLQYEDPEWCDLLLLFPESEAAMAGAS
jgi:hypothetical protein